jgi:hypothetical protein
MADATAIVESVPSLIVRCPFGADEIQESEWSRSAVYLGSGQWVLPEGWRVLHGDDFRLETFRDKSVWVPDYIHFIFRDNKVGFRIPSEFVWDFAQLGPSDRMFHSVGRELRGEHYHWIRLEAGHGFRCSMEDKCWVYGYED